jgi:hypothetical protein
MKRNFLLLAATMQLLFLAGSCTKETIKAKVYPVKDFKCGNVSVLKSSCGYLLIADGNGPSLLADSTDVKSRFGISIFTGERLSVSYDQAPGIKCDCIMNCDGHSIMCCPDVTIKDITQCQ